MTNKSRERSYKQIVKLVNEIAENYDSVQIFLTKHSDKSQHIEDTESIYYGIGNKFAILGQIKSWIIFEESKMKRMAEIEFDLDMSEGTDDNEGEDGGENE